MVRYGFVLSLVLTLGGLTRPVAAQTSVFKIEDNTGTTLLLVNDDGTITLPTGATNGYVLTTDANGNATWMPASGGGSLTLPFAGTTASASTAFSVENTGTGRGLESTAQATALQVSSALQEGLRVSSAGTRGVFVVQSSAEAFGAQFVGGDGVIIFRAGSPSATNTSPLSNGFEIDGAEGNGLFVGRADQNGVRVESAGSDGVSVLSAGDDGVGVFFAQGEGFYVESAGLNGLKVDQAFQGDGVHISRAGNPSTTASASPLSNGFEVKEAEGHGLYVGHADQDGVHVESAGGTGVRVVSSGDDGVSVDSADDNGVQVLSAGRTGVLVNSANENGVLVISAGSSGFFVLSAGDDGVTVGAAGKDGVHVGSAGSPTTTTSSSFNNGFEVSGAEGHGLFVGHADRDGVRVLSAGNRAGFFGGDVEVTGNLTKGSGTFKIDHPLDPTGKYLSHSFVESPDMMNVYNGTLTLNAQGQAVVELPDYFEALNRDFRYQLTAVGAPGPNLYIAEKITSNQFKIGGGTPGLEVSWQVTGIRQDPYAEQNRVVVEEDKSLEERGYYLHPEAYGQPKERSIGHVEAMAHRLDEKQQ